ncbi:hypothetical protein PVPAM_040007300 [Plasmodium vivax]|nr:hypothetical protein PVPAM_040007300 [Plasmodium vivax]
MSSNEWGEQYLNHDDYAFFKPRFEKDIEISDEKRENLKDIINRLEKESYDTKKFNNLLELLMKYLNSGHVMFHCRDDKCCRYINYTLAKKVQQKDNAEYTKTTFDIFKKFMEKFYDVIGSHSCKKRLGYIKPLILSRMDILYDLYNNYSDLISLNSNDESNKLCSTLSLVVMKYKEAINKHEGDENFISQLKQLRNLILSKKPKYYSECRWDLSSIALPEPVISRQVEMQANQLSSHVPTQQSVQDEVEKSNIKANASGEPELSGLPGLQPQSLPLAEAQPLPLTPLSADPHSDQLQSGHSKSAHLLPEQFTREKPEAAELHVIKFPSIEHSQRGWRTREVNASIDEETYTSEYPNKGAEHTYGLLNKMQYFFSESLGQVQPGPVLGVSGGMGVLFLLFKYTPVGSFFGGRRGRFRQIPRTFGGFPPGDFGHFQEYGGGYVGYSQMDMPFQGE